jgi:hypothetical protein
MYEEWYEEYEEQRRQAQETLERGLAQYALTRGLEEWKKSGRLLNGTYLSKIRQWLPTETLSEEEERFLIESETSYQTQQQKQARGLQQAILGSLLFLIGAVIIGFGLLFILEVKQVDKITAAISQLPVTTTVPVPNTNKTMPLAKAQPDLKKSNKTSRHKKRKLYVLNLYC